MRRYPYCAKCGKANDRADSHPGSFLCADCHGTPGQYLYCAVGGGAWPADELAKRPERDDDTCWVCYVHIRNADPGPNPDSAPCGDNRGRVYPRRQDDAERPARRVVRLAEQYARLDTAAAGVLDAYQHYLDSDDLDVLRDALTALEQARHG